MGATALKCELIVTFDIKTIECSHLTPETTSMLPSHMSESQTLFAITTIIMKNDDNMSNKNNKDNV